jgi:hypothetical protein
MDSNNVTYYGNYLIFDGNNVTYSTYHHILYPTSHIMVIILYTMIPTITLFET